MKLSNDYQYIVLCEDAQMKSFILQFLKAHGIRDIRFRNYPAGKGCGEFFVKKEYCTEVEYLKRNNFRRIVLIVCTDADRLSCDDRIKSLENEIHLKGNWSYKSERIIMWIPKREIETWIHFLRGEKTDETVEYRHSGDPVKCKDEAIAMMEYCRDMLEVNQSILPSLKMAKEEYQRVCLLQGQA